MTRFIQNQWVTGRQKFVQNEKTKMTDNYTLKSEGIFRKVKAFRV